MRTRSRASTSASSCTQARTFRRRDLRALPRQAQRPKRCCINYDPSHFRLQALDYVGFIDVYHERIKAFHAGTPSSGRRRSRASTRASRTGPIAPAASGRWVMAMSTSALFSRAFPSTATTAGRCSSGNARSRTGGRRARGRRIHQEAADQVSQLSFEDFIDQGADRSAINRALGIGA